MVYPLSSLCSIFLSFYISSLTLVDSRGMDETEQSAPLNIYHQTALARIIKSSSRFLFILAPTSFSPSSIVYFSWSIFLEIPGDFEAIEF